MTSRASELGRERLAFGGTNTVPRRRAGPAAPREKPADAVSTAEVRSQEWGFFGLLAFTAVLVLRPQDQIPALGALHLAEVCAFLGVAPMLVHRMVRRLPIIRLTPETIGVMVFGLALLGTAPFSIWPGGAVRAVLETYLKVIVVFVLMMNTLTTQHRLEQLTRVILVCSGYIAVLALSNYARGINLVEGERMDGPVRGFMGNPNDLAMNMVTFLPLAITIALTRRISGLRRFMAGGIAMAMFATIVLTKSRSGALGLVVMLTALIVLGRKIRPGFAGLALVAVLATVPLLPSSFWMRMSSIIDAKQDRQMYTGSRETRSTVMKEGLDTFLEHPFSGVGAGQFKNYNPAGRKERWRETHNSLLQVAAETGIVGLAAFIFLICRAAVLCLSNLRLLGRSRKRDADPLRDAMSADDRQALYAQSAGLLAGLVGWFVCSMFASIAYGWTFYYLLALIVATRELIRRRLTQLNETEQKRTPASIRLPLATRSVARGGI